MFKNALFLIMHFFLNFDILKEFYQSIFSLVHVTFARYLLLIFQLYECFFYLYL